MAPGSDSSKQPLANDAGPTVALEGRLLSKAFPVPGRRGMAVHAVSGVSISVLDRGITGIVGESGSGKTTLLRLLALLEPPSGGEILLRGRVVGRRGHRHLVYRSQVQLLMQDPFASLNPARTIGYHVERALRLHGPHLGARGRSQRLQQVLEQVNLVPAERFLGRYPHELSGGQRQRVMIARALAVRPSVLLADEPVSMLDVSMQVDVLNLLRDLRDGAGLAVIYVTHNIGSARYLCEDINVMYAGQLVEGGPASEVTSRPAHPYTKLLMRSTPSPSRRKGEGECGIAIAEDNGEAPNLIDLPSGCAFRNRCPEAGSRCASDEPPPLTVAPGHWARCWLYDPAGTGRQPAETAGAVGDAEPAAG